MIVSHNFQFYHRYVSFPGALSKMTLHLEIVTTPKCQLAILSLARHYSSANENWLFHEITNTHSPALSREYRQVNLSVPNLSISYDYLTKRYFAVQVVLWLEARICAHHDTSPGQLAISYCTFCLGRACRCHRHRRHLRRRHQW